MTVHVASGGRQRTVTTTARRLKGYADSRVAYDRRRRAPLDPVTKREMRRYAALLRGDPCSYCMDFCGQMAADHIVPLELGGENAAENLTAAGRPCNAAKKAKPLLIFLLERT